ncbi:SRPBCC family protein [Williamsia sp.]|uniref:SRPBCC family protein n=1 Tax=Williamsia sp. TaxID=1872085 RepID=UPI002F9510FB
MTSTDPDLDLSVSRIIKAPREVVWSAWTDPSKFEQWWLPAPATCKVARMDLRPGGAFETEMSEDGGDFGPHITGCFLAVDHLERIVFTTSLVAGWRPARDPFLTAIITFADHPEGTEYTATAMHKDGADRDMHNTMGFQEGWGTVARQLAELVERGD